MHRPRANLLIGLTIGALVLLPAASANHLASAGDCTGSRETLLAGGLVEFALGIGPGSLYCHFDGGCPNADPCSLEITLTARGTGIIEGMIEPLQGDPLTTCGPSPLECTLSVVAQADGNHELHVNCGFGLLTFAVDVEFECSLRPA